MCAGGADTTDGGEGLTTTGTTPLSGPLPITFGAPVDVTGSWNGTLAGVGATLTATFPSWAPTLAPGATDAIGYLVAGSPSALAG
jgi:endoglucanase